MARRGDDPNPIGSEDDRDRGTPERQRGNGLADQVKEELADADRWRRRADLERRMGNEADARTAEKEAEKHERRADELRATDPVGAALGAARPAEPPQSAPTPERSSVWDRWPGGSIARGTATASGPAASAPAQVTDQAMAATAPAPAPANLGGTPNPDGKFGIPGGAQVWEGPDNFWYAVYTVPGTNPPVPMAWRIENDDDVAAIFGAGNEWRTDRKLNADEWKAAGVLTFGSSRNLANTSEHPFDAFVNNFATEAAVRPWLRDPEILALTTRAILENRTVTDAELSGTEWWRTRTEGERQWIATFNADPKTAQQRVQDGRDSVRKLMITAGIGNPPDRLVQLIGDRMTAGTWSQQYVQNQVMKVADPAAPGDLDPTLGIWLGDLAAEGVQMNTLADNTSKVEKLVRTWLGPAFGTAGWTQQQMEHWSGRLRNDPNAEQELTTQLQRQRLVLFPQYTDPNATYDDIASTWRGVVQNSWGEVADETDPLFLEIVKTNDLATAQQMLRKTGRERGVKKVVDETLSDMGKAFPSIRRSA